MTRKSELLELQKAARPFGGFATVHWNAGTPPLRVFASPGPIYEPEGGRPDYWRLARALFAAGFRRGDLVHNCFSYHLTPAGSMLETGAHALGCTVFPGGVGQTELQVQAMAELGATGYVGTPSFLRIILEKADELAIALPSLRKALVSGEAFPATLRDAWIARGIDGYQVYATADLGTIAYETPAREGLVIDEGVLVEIVRPGTGDPVAAGEVGEVVVTTLFNADYPLIRFGTGDLSAFLPGTSPCGRTNARINGWMGRADQTTKVHGMFVHPGAGRGDRRPPSGNREGAARRRQSRRPRRDDARRRTRSGQGVLRRGHRSDDARRDQAARRSALRHARCAAQRRQGDRRSSPLRLSASAKTTMARARLEAPTFAWSFA